MSALTLALLIVAAYAMVALNALLDRHGKCISCGRRFEHAPNCPTVKERP